MAYTRGPLNQKRVNNPLYKGPGGQTSYEKPQWRFRELLNALGDAEAISHALVMRGYPRVPPQSIVGWEWRNTVPSVWLPVILQMGIEHQFIEKIEDLRVL